MATLQGWGTAVATLQEWGTAVATLQEWATAVATLQEWRTAVVRVRPAAAALDLATLGLGIRGTTLSQREAPIRKTLRTKAELMTAEAFPATRRTLWRKITRLTLRRQTKSCRLKTEDRERKKDLLIHFRPAGSSRLIAA